MKRLLAIALLTFSSIGFAQTPQIKGGSTVYIEPMGGYETYLAAAMVKKHVPLVVVADKEKAAYIITSTVAHNDLSGGQPMVVVNNNNTAAVVNGNVSGATPGSSVQNAMQRGYAAGAAERRALGETSASIAVIDAQSSKVVFAHAAGKMGTNQLQKTAEDCAKHLKKFIEKSEKSKK
ncbi:MAG: hypothetical protein ACYCPO_09595 [Acidobacteriaceae bacterium]